MNQSNLDVWEIRGLSAIVRILEDRLEDKVGYTPITTAVLRSYLTRLEAVLSKMESRPADDSDPLSDITRMDRWFYTGFENLLIFLRERVRLGPPMPGLTRDQLLNMVTLSLGERNESGSP